LEVLELTEREPMKNYTIEWMKDGEPHTDTISAVTPGQAQAKFKALHPCAILTRCFWSGHLGGNTRLPIGTIEYEMVSGARVSPLEPEPAREQAAFGFLDKVKRRPR